MSERTTCETTGGGGSVRAEDEGAEPDGAARARTATNGAQRGSGASVRTARSPPSRPVKRAVSPLVVSSCSFALEVREVGGGAQCAWSTLRQVVSEGKVPPQVSKGAPTWSSSSPSRMQACARHTFSAELCRTSANRCETAAKEATSRRSTRKKSSHKTSSDKSTRPVVSSSWHA